MEKAIYQKNQIVSHLFSKKFAYNSRNQGDLSILHVSTDCSYCTVPARDQKHESGSGIHGGTKIIERVVLHKGVFQKILKLLGASRYTDIFASRLRYQVPRYVSWHPNSHAWMANAFLRNWKNLQPYTFHLFALIARVSAKVIHQLSNRRCGTHNYWNWW